MDDDLQDQIEKYIDGLSEEIPWASETGIGKTIDYYSGRNRYIGYLTGLAKKSYEKHKIFPAQWNVYGKSAGFIRNAEMGHYADAAICFWDGKSRGTQHMINTMRHLQKPVFVFNYEGELMQ